MFKAAVIVGSLRKDSFNLKIAKILIGMAPANLSFELLSIADLPLYNQDSDETPPESYKTFRERLKAFDAVLFVTPEYNRSVPGVLKNAIDVGSRPHGQSAWEGKPAAVVSVSPGAVGGFGANHHLRQSLVFLNMPAMAQPEVYLGGVAKLLDESGNLKEPSTKEFLNKFLLAFEKWVGVNVRK